MAAAGATTVHHKHEQILAARPHVAVYERKKLSRCDGQQCDERGRYRCARVTFLPASNRLSWRRRQQRSKSSSCGGSRRILATYCSLSSSSFPQPQFMPPSSLPQHDVDIQGLRVAIEVKGDAFSGRRQSRHILNGIDLKVPRGHMHMILGLNGSGKVCMTSNYRLQYVMNGYLLTRTCILFHFLQIHVRIHS